MSGSAAVVDCVTDRDQGWMSSLRRRVEEVELRRRRGGGGDVVPRTIFRVPANMREGDPGAYEPRIVSFGPFHRANPALQSVSQLKLRYLQKLLLRNCDAALDDYLRLIQGLEARARASYSEDVDMESNAFVEMMLLDACFIVEILLMQTDGDSYNEEEEEEEEDPVVTTNWTLPLIEYDMLMLENQIPYFVTESVFELATGANSGSSLAKLLLAFFDDLVPCGRTTAPLSEEAVPTKFHHVLHFVHSCIVPEQYQYQQRRQAQSSKTNKQSYNPLIYLKLHRVYRRLLSSLSSRSVDSGQESSLLLLTPESIPSAISLKEAGVEFKERRSDSFLDVAFRDGTMEIPALRVCHHTNSLFRNLIAFEQCLPEVGTHVATYALLMDCLVDTGEDVALLHRYGCIVNGLGSGEEAAVLFNRLCKEVTVEYGSCYLAGLFKDVRRHCDSRWNKWRAKLMHDYFSNPWAVLSLAGAVILIFLTVVQTFLAVLSYFKPPT